MEGTIGEIRMFASNFQPKSWSFCQGQLVSIASNTALFSILGTTFGGDGVNTFQLPDFRGRLASGTGTGPGLNQVNLGQTGGSTNRTLTLSNLPTHTHTAQDAISIPFLADDGNSNEASSATVFSNAPSGKTIYSTNSPDSTLKPFTAPVIMQNAGGSYPIETVQPYIGMNFIICQYGIYPSRN